MTRRGKALQSGSYAIDARRLHQTRSRVVSFSILSRFGHRRRGDGVFMSLVRRRFAERVDLIVLLFDPFKLDISDELTGVIRRFRGHEDKVRVVLNKSADSASV